MHSNFEGNAPVYPNQNMQNQEYMSIMYAKKIKQDQMNFISQQNYLLKLNQLQNAYLAQQSNPQTEFQNYNRNAYTSLSRSANVNKDYPNQFYNQPSQHYNSENYYAPHIHQNTQFNRYQNSSNYQYGYSSQNISTNFQNCHFRFPKDNRKSPDFKSPFYPPDK
ncbi:hypothetical protein A3Q56_04778 [Intoshia linei]|uniref:Uncharacterized protein n=1 Tax=Intoshia linei TaxID=1819745 RepID=A0A177AZP8_9BILA|nr:hypothetical protein A3Q56_04778 [Intoshia linei]